MQRISVGRQRHASPTPRARHLLASALSALLLAGPALAEEDHSHHHHHHAVSLDAGYTRGEARVALPAVTLRRTDGARVNFKQDMDDARPVLVNFIYTTCTAICPPMTQVFSAFQDKLGDERAKVRMISITIDPEQDTPARLAAYARKHKAGPQWTFYTGTAEASIAVQKGFGAWRGDKMNHTPATWMRAAPGKDWVQLDGFTTPDELLTEFRSLTAAK